MPEKSAKPEKPYPEFPLFAHATGRWAKKIKGRMCYFGPWSDWEAALKKYERQASDLHAGRVPEPEATALTVGELCNRFLNSKRLKTAGGKMKPVTFADYQRAATFLIDSLGANRDVERLKPADFEGLLAAMQQRGWGPVYTGNTVQRLRTICRYAYDTDLVTRPIKVGPEFRRPERRVLRLAKAANGKRMIEAEELRAIFADSPNRTLRAMILLAINCGYGNHDVAALTRAHLDLDGGWVHYPRPKTGIDRRCPLWPETVAALRDVLAHRRKPNNKAHADLVFVTKFGGAFHKDVENAATFAKGSEETLPNSDPVTHTFTALLKKLGIYRRGVGFYAIRHTFETVAGDSRDQVAVDHIMGHDRGEMSNTYRERIDDARLWAVVNHVHDWLYAVDRPATATVASPTAAFPEHA